MFLGNPTAYATQLLTPTTSERASRRKLSASTITCFECYTLEPYHIEQTYTDDALIN